MARFSITCALYAGLLLTAACADGTTCPPGQFITDSGSCRKCPKGTFQPKAGQNNCKPCADGKVSMEEGSAECVSCEKHAAPNEYKNSCTCITGAIYEADGVTCTLCPPGTRYYRRPRGKRVARCYNCPRGSYQPESGKTDCIPCQQGFTSGTGDTECFTCSENEIVSFNGTCVTCPAGQTAAFESYCTECEEATVKSDEGIHPCEFCPAGKEPNEKKTACVPTPCPTGFKLLKKGMKKECGKCPAGHHYNKRTFKCRPCSKNTYMPYENVNNWCYACAENEHAFEKGSTECSRCPQGQRILANGECGSCPDGYMYKSGNGKCISCHLNTFRAGSMISCEHCPPGLFSLPKSPTCFSCPPGQAIIKATGKCGVCPAGSSYDEYKARCEKCPIGYFKGTFGNKYLCYNCPEGTVSNESRTDCVTE